MKLIRNTLITLTLMVLIPFFTIISVGVYYFIKPFLKRRGQ